MTQIVKMSSFNLKKYNAFNKENPKLKDKELFDEVGKMLVNYKWSVAHLEKINEELAKNATEQFDKLVKLYDVIIAKPEKKQ